MSKVERDSSCEASEYIAFQNILGAEFVQKIVDFCFSKWINYSLWCEDRVVPENISFQVVTIYFTKNFYHFYLTCYKVSAGFLSIYMCCCCKCAGCAVVVSVLGVLLLQVAPGDQRPIYTSFTVVSALCWYGFPIGISILLVSLIATSDKLIVPTFLLLLV